MRSSRRSLAFSLRAAVSASVAGRATPRPQHVVERDQPAGAEQPGQRLVVGVVVRLVGVDEREVVGPGLAGSQTRVERFQAGASTGWILCSTPACFQNGRPTRVYSSLMSPGEPVTVLRQRQSHGPARWQPVKVPISIARCAPRRTSRAARTALVGRDLHPGARMRARLASGGRSARGARAQRKWASLRSRTAGRRDGSGPQGHGAALFRNKGW